MGFHIYSGQPEGELRPAYGHVEHRFRKQTVKAGALSGGKQSFRRTPEEIEADKQRKLGLRK